MMPRQGLPGGVYSMLTWRVGEVCGHQRRVEFRRNGPVLRSRQWTPAMETDLPVARGSDELGVERANKRSEF